MYIGYSAGTSAVIQALKPASNGAIYWTVNQNISNPYATIGLQNVYIADSQVRSLCVCVCNCDLWRRVRGWETPMCCLSTMSLTLAFLFRFSLYICLVSDAAPSPSPRHPFLPSCLFLLNSCPPSSPDPSCFLLRRASRRSTSQPARKSGRCLRGSLILNCPSWRSPHTTAMSSPVDSPPLDCQHWMQPPAMSSGPSTTRRQAEEGDAAVCVCVRVPVFVISYFVFFCVRVCLPDCELNVYLCVCS